MEENKTKEELKLGDTEERIENITIGEVLKKQDRTNILLEKIDTSINTLTTSNLTSAKTVTAAITPVVKAKTPTSLPASNISNLQESTTVSTVNNNQIKNNSSVTTIKEGNPTIKPVIKIEQANIKSSLKDNRNSQLDNTKKSSVARQNPTKIEKVNNSPDKPSLAEKANLNNTDNSNFKNKVDPATTEKEPQKKAEPKAKETKEKREESQKQSGTLKRIETVVKAGITAPFTALPKVIDAAASDSSVKDSAGLAAGGSFYAAAKEIVAAKDDPIVKAVINTGKTSFDKTKSLFSKKEKDKSEAPKVDVKKTENEIDDIKYKKNKAGEYVSEQGKFLPKEQVAKIKEKESLENSTTTKKTAKIKDRILKQYKKLFKIRDKSLEQEKEELKHNKKALALDKKALKAKNKGKGYSSGDSKNDSFLGGFKASSILAPVAAAGSALAGLAVTGKDAFDVFSSIKEGKEIKKEDAGGVAGGVSGALAGGAAGAAIGSVVPVVGTVLGGIIGAGLGAFGGNFAGEQIGKKLDKNSSSNKTTKAEPRKLSGQTTSPAKNLTENRSKSANVIQKDFAKATSAPVIPKLIYPNFRPSKPAKNNSNKKTERQSQGAITQQITRDDKTNKLILSELKTLNKNLSKKTDSPSDFENPYARKMINEIESQFD